MPDSSFSASSDSGEDYDASKGRLNGPSAWCPELSVNEFIEIKLPTEMEICAIETQGSSSLGSFVTKYIVKISQDRQEWHEFVSVFLNNFFMTLKRASSVSRLVFC